MNNFRILLRFIISRRKMIECAITNNDFVQCLLVIEFDKKFKFCEKCVNSDQIYFNHT